MTDFADTSIAFHSKTSADLRRSYWLFRAMDFPWLVKLGTKLITVALALRLPIEWLIERTLFRQFCGGETLEACRRTVEELARFGVGTVLEYSVEGNGTEAAFDATAEEKMRAIEFAHGNRHVPFCVVKMTGIARFGLLKRKAAETALSAEENGEWKRVHARVERLCEAAHRLGVQLFIDAEESWTQDAVDRLALEMMERFNGNRAVVHETVQLYRHDRLAFLRERLRLAEKKKFRYGVKLVRGAYLEKERDRAAELGLPSPLQPDKAATDREYDAAVALALEHPARAAVCIGTHNESSTRTTIERMEKLGLAKNDPRVWFAQLYGMGDHLSFNLADGGYNVAKYVPYGPIRAVIPYLFRRAEENTSVRGQSSRELQLLTRERKRRASQPPRTARTLSRHSDPDMPQGIRS